jgi:CheY-like chemotaxis protein
MENMEDQKKILLIDDNRTILKAMEKLLTGAGHEVFTSDDGREAIRIAAAEQPDLIISDVDMPEMDGGEVAAKLKESPKTKHITVIFFTTLVTKNDSESNNSGKNVYISKMTEHNELLAEIEKYL